MNKYELIIHITVWGYVATSLFHWIKKTERSLHGHRENNGEWSHNHVTASVAFKAVPDYYGFPVLEIRTK